MDREVTILCQHRLRAINKDLRLDKTSRQNQTFALRDQAADHLKKTKDLDPAVTRYIYLWQY